MQQAFTSHVPVSTVLSGAHSRHHTFPRAAHQVTLENATAKTIALTRWTFVGKVMSLLFNMLSRLVIGEGNGITLQYSFLENPMDGEAW